MKAQPEASIWAAMLLAFAAASFGASGRALADTGAASDWDAAFTFCRAGYHTENDNLSTIYVTIAASEIPVCVDDLWILEIESSPTSVANAYDVSARQCVPLGERRSGGVFVSERYPPPAAYCVVLSGGNPAARSKFALDAFESAPESAKSLYARCQRWEAVDSRCRRRKRITGGFAD